MNSLFVPPSSSYSESSWEVVIGLEVHAQIVSESKLFSGASTQFASPANTQVSFIDGGFPGQLPVLNQFCVEQAIRTGLALDAHIHPISSFDRKNYFYADLPTGYQISQFYHPIVTQGKLDIDFEDGSRKRIRINRLHLEQDAGKSFHDQHPHKSYIDLNRAGVGLMEIVSEPDLCNAEEAILYLKKLRSLLRAIGTCNGNMEEGNFRADVNISLRRPGAPLGTRCEIKNVNSFKFIQQAIAYEIERQSGLLGSGQSVVQETRLYDPSTGETRSMRTKEDSHDYRYFPDPDLLPVIVSDEWIDAIRQTLPELPSTKRKRFMEAYSLTQYEATLLSEEGAVALFFEEGLSHLQNPSSEAKILSSWILGDLFAKLNKDSLSIEQSPVSAPLLASMISLITTDIITGRIAKEVFGHMWETQEDPRDIVKRHNLVQINDEVTIRQIAEKVLAENPNMVEEYRQGREKVFGFFVGQTIKQLGGKANPSLVNSILKTLLTS